MEQDIVHIKKALNRNRLAIFAVVAFLSLMTYLLIVVSQNVTEQTSISRTSMAAESDTEDDMGTMMPTDPAGIWPPTCNDYSEYISRMKERARKAAANIKYKVKINGEIIKGTCDRYIYDRITPTGTQTQGSAEPLARLDEPSQCAEITALYRELEEVEKFMNAKCKQCPGEVLYPTPIIPRPTQNQAVTLPGGSLNDGSTQQDPSTLYYQAR